MSEWHRRNIDPNTTNGVWDLHEEVTELLLAIYEGLYEEGEYVHSLRLQDVFHALRNTLLWCESLEGFETIKSGVKFDGINSDSDETHIKSINDLYIGSTNTLMEREWLEEERSFGLLPDNYTVPCVSVGGDSILWEKRWKKRVLLYQKHLCVVASGRRKDDRKLTPDESKKFSPAMGLYQRALLLLWDMERYTDPLNVLNQEFNETVPLDGKIRFHLSTGHIYYGHALVAKPQRYSQQWVVWKKLHESRTRPRKALYAHLKVMENDESQRIFPHWDKNTLSSLLSRWNEVFEKEYSITPLHQAYDSIELRITRKSNNEV
ncbi:MAG: hypothetical protein PHZ00_05965 [Candidatus Peribacteraceae bacterium]|nr:hypothetical protein [Candidatus Peribacteraceae bacterium]